MIQLDVKDYCQNCVEFEPTVDKMDCSSVGDSERKCIMIVSCRYKDRCSSIVENLKKELG